MIKFNKFNVRDTEKNVTARVFYHLDNRTDGRRVVTMYAKDYNSGLGKIFADATTNDSDYQSDYVVTDTVRLFEDHPLYAQARAHVEALNKAKKAA